MLESLTLVIATITSLNCPQTRIVDMTDNWTSRDQKEYETILKTHKCKNKPGNPCLKRVIKKAERNYYLICGPQIEKKD